MDGWPTYVLPDWKQPMALDNEDLLDEAITEIAGNDMDNAWYRPSDYLDTEADVLNYQIYNNDEIIDESQFELEVMENTNGQIRANSNVKMEQTVPPGSTRILKNLKFTSRDGVSPEDIVFIIISRLPAGFATIERAPYGPQLEFTQYDIDQGDVIIKTNEHWPGHDLIFEFLVQDPQGTTIDPYQFTIKSPKLQISQGESAEINLLELGIEEDALYDPDAFLLLQVHP